MTLQPQASYPLDVVFIYASEEVIQELDIDRMPPF